MLSNLLSNYSLSKYLRFVIQPKQQTLFLPSTTLSSVSVKGLRLRHFRQPSNLRASVFRWSLPFYTSFIYCFSLNIRLWVSVHIIIRSTVQTWFQLKAEHLNIGNYTHVSTGLGFLKERLKWPLTLTRFVRAWKEGD
jgi:hypothetical protein